MTYMNSGANIKQFRLVKFINENPSIYDPRKVIMSGSVAMNHLIEEKINILK